jgi:hypothetical protein
MDRKLAVFVIVALATTGCYHRAAQYRPARAAAAGKEMSAVVVNGSFIVEPRNYKFFKVVVGGDMSRACVEGTFSATGANNDIEVSVLEETQYLNWQNRHKFEAAYQSGRVTAGKLKVELPLEPATYFIVFSNRFSLISNKSVVADLKLQYANTN